MAERTGFVPMTPEQMRMVREGWDEGGPSASAGEILGLRLRVEKTERTVEVLRRAVEELLRLHAGGG